MAWLKEEQLSKDELYVTTDNTVWYGGQLVSFDQNSNSAVITRVAKEGGFGKPMVFSVDNFRARFRLFNDYLLYVKGVSSDIVDCAVHIFKRLAVNSGHSEIRLLLPFSEAEKTDLLGKLLLEFNTPQNAFRFELGERDNVTKKQDTVLVIKTERL